jgi:hypothetical protein
MIKLILEITPNNLFKSKKSERSPQIIRKRICVKKIKKRAFFKFSFYKLIYIFLKS